MRIIISCVLVAVVVMLGAGCNSDDSHGSSKPANKQVELKTQTPSDGVRRITVTELKAAVEKGNALVVDVRTPEAYAGEHIKGSVNIPEHDTLTRSGEFPRDKLIVFYCS